MHVQYLCVCPFRQCSNHAHQERTTESVNSHTQASGICSCVTSEKCFAHLSMCEGEQRESFFSWNLQ